MINLGLKMLRSGQEEFLEIHSLRNFGLPDMAWNLDSRPARNKWSQQYVKESPITTPVSYPDSLTVSTSWVGVAHPSVSGDQLQRLRVPNRLRDKTAHTFFSAERFSDISEKNVLSFIRFVSLGTPPRSM